MVNNMDHGLPKFSLLGYDDWKIMMEAHLYALHDCMWMVLEDGPLKIQMENPERNPATPDVVQYIPKPKEKWDDRDCKKHNLDNVAKAAIFKTLDPITFSKIKHLKTAMEIWQGLGKLCEGSEDLRKQKIEVLLEKFKSFKMLPGESFDMLDERFHKILNDLASLNHVLSPKEKNVSSSTPTLPDEIPETWTKKVQGLIESALASQHASFRQEIELMEAKHTELIEKSEEKHSADLKEISKSIEKTLEIISLLSKTVSNTMEIYTSDSQLQFNEFNKVKEQIANVTVGLQKQMSLLQMDIRSALAIASANQEAYKLFRLIGAHSGNRKMEVILQQHSPSPIPQLPIAVKEGEVSYIPSHLNLTNLILEAQQRNPENSAQQLSSSGLDGTEFIGAVADHFSDAAQSEERRENLRRIKELCGNMQGISEVAGSSKRKRN
ncbi:unnamed protein product [Cuscuta campestris]|uniref:DUF4219 domain-containing protein n=1 Tax=Cuscuta campestris TaxID=132261 RepID=A0A484MET0_9ASTE|nr:unnamed protein product [Cuscuta campestris]